MNDLSRFDDNAAAGNVTPAEPIGRASRIPNGFFTLTLFDGSHKTFRIHTKGPDAKFAPGKRIFSLLIGPDGTTDYEGQAFVDDDGIHVWKNKRGSKERPSKIEQYAAIVWSLAIGEPIEGYELLTDKRCLICNRQLTTPQSLARGIGPVCYGVEE